MKLKLFFRKLQLKTLINSESPFSSSLSSFTLVELLIVIGILAILTAAVVLVLNPAELLRRSRDTTRMSDMASIYSAVSLALTQDPSLFLGIASTVYVSLPDTSSSCANLGLPSLPSGYSYRCASATTSSQVNGTGWLPINFVSSSIGGLPKLPIDPVNTTSSGFYYYTYITNGTQYQLSSLMESSKYTTQESLDGGADPVQYEVGTNLSLAPFLHGLVGWWNFDEASGSIAYDYSGYGNHGTMYASSTIVDLHTSSGCKIGRCGNFNGIDNLVTAQGGSVMIPDGKGNAMTVMAWAYKTNINGGMVAYQNGPFFLSMGTVMGSGGTEIHTPNNWKGVSSSQSLNINTWYHLAITYDSQKNLITNYVNGVQDGTGYQTGLLNPALSCVGIGYATWGGCSGPLTNFFPGLIDDIRVYNRALSDAEIKALYNATK